MLHIANSSNALFSQSIKISLNMKRIHNLF